MSTLSSSSWDEYPTTYRSHEVQRVLRATHAGESAAIIGLSGAGKSNVMGFIAHCQARAGAPTHHAYLLIDCNRLGERSPAALYRLIRRTFDPNDSTLPTDEFDALIVSLGRHVSAVHPVTLLLDRFDDVARDADPSLFNNLRSLRDVHKYHLTYVTSARRPLAGHTELAELFYANTIWLGCLSEADSRWNVTRFARRKGLQWNEATATALIEASRGYPSLLRACCEAHAAGASFEPSSLAEHPAVKQRITEFWADGPGDEEIKQAGLAHHPLLMRGRSASFDTTQLTAKEHALWSYLQSRPNQVCEKDDIIRAVWPEDKIIERGIRDDSLAQLMRRLREKIEPESASPHHILTVPGRGYRFVP